MTYKEKLMLIHPGAVDADACGGCYGCPGDYSELNDVGLPAGECDCSEEVCTRCWNREIPTTEPTADEVPHIRDSGTRQEFSTGAVRDMGGKEKGRCDLLPLDVVGVVMNDGLLHCLEMFKEHGDALSLEEALKMFTQIRGWDLPTMILEVSKHFAEGAEKYSENNWMKGIPLKSYLNSSVRHYLKWVRGDKDEFHDRAFCWNVICAIWTCEHKPELNDYGKHWVCPVCGTVLPESEDECPHCKVWVKKQDFDPDDFLCEHEEEWE